MLVLLRHWLLPGLLLRWVRVAILGLHVSLWGSAIALLRLRLLWVAAATAVRHLAIHGRTRHVARLTSVGHLRCTVTSTATETTAAAASEAAATRTSVRSFVNTNLSSVEFDVVHGSNSLLRIFFLGVAHEAEATATACVAVFNDYSFFDNTKLLELLAQSGLLGVPGEAADEKLRHDADEVGTGTAERTNTRKRRSENSCPCFNTSSDDAR